MKPHGEAEHRFLFFEKCSFSARAMYQAGNTGQRRRSSARREHRRRREIGKVIKPARVPKQLRVSRCKAETARLLEEKALEDEEEARGAHGLCSEGHEVKANMKCAPKKMQYGRYTQV